jgi:hypothetical protein
VAASEEKKEEEPRSNGHPPVKEDLPIRAPLGDCAPIRRMSSAPRIPVPWVRILDILVDHEDLSRNDRKEHNKGEEKET